LFQHWEDRSPSSVYEELAVFKKESNVRGVYQRLGLNVPASTSASSVTVTKLVLIISNWSFVRDNKTNPRKIKCTSQDVTVGLKLASSSFRTAPPTDQKRQPYDFDKNGLVMPYPAFLSLMRNKEFTEGYIKKIKDHYTRDTGDRLVRPEQAGSSTSSKKPSKPSAATLRRQYAEAFPELADSSEGLDNANSRKKKKQPQVRVKPARGGDREASGDSEISESEPDEEKKARDESNYSSSNSSTEGEEEEEEERSNKRTGENEEEEEAEEEEEEEEEDDRTKRVVPIEEKSSDQKKASSSSRSKGKTVAASKVVKAPAKTIKSNRRSVKQARKK